jgi:hypothetical protein
MNIKTELAPRSPVDKIKLVILIITFFAAAGNSYSGDSDWGFKHLSATKKEINFDYAYRFHIIITLKNTSEIESKPDIKAIVEVISGGETVYKLEDVLINSGKYVAPGEEINIRKSLSRDALKRISEEPYAVIRITIGGVSKTFTVINTGYLSDGKKLSRF